MLIFYFLDLPIIQKIIPNTRTTIKTPTHTPALKIPSIAAQLLIVVTTASKHANKTALLFFMMFIFILVNS